MCTQLLGRNGGRRQAVISHHYFSRKPGSLGKKYLLSLHIRGLTLEFITYSSLFSGKEIDKGTKLLLEYIKIPQEGIVLDMGCGYGVIGIVLAKINPKLKVYMVDINPLAVKTAKQNAKINNVEDNIVVLHGDLYEPVKGMMFDAIYSNPPLSAGKNVVEKIIVEGKNHLKENGFMQLVLAKGGNYYAEIARKKYSRIEIVKKQGYTILTAYMK